MTMKTRFADAFCGPPGRKSRRPKRLLAHGIEDVKKFFIALDEPFITQHFVDVVYQYGNAYFMQGSASLRKKGDPPEKSFQAAPLFNLLWFNDEGKVIRYVVDFPPDAAAAAGL